ncbi:MAG: hypothetical protein E6R04_11175 [Spirochaetes bacterium]|nr:MAG: hypothetical protein E6R04_11175 [Spirochaetota bacterium]
MYRESSEPLEKPVGPSFWERLGAWWVNLKKRWPGDRVWAGIAFFTLVSVFSFFATLLFARHEGGNIYLDTIPAKVLCYFSIVTIMPALIALLVVTLLFATGLFLVMIGKRGENS